MILFQKLILQTNGVTRVLRGMSEWCNGSRYLFASCHLQGAEIWVYIYIECIYIYIECIYILYIDLMLQVLLGSAGIFIWFIHVFRSTSGHENDEILTLRLPRSGC